MPEANQRVDPSECSTRMRWAPCLVGYQPESNAPTAEHLYEMSCERCADGKSGPGGSLSETCAHCGAGRAGTGGLCNSHCSVDEQPAYNRLRCESCKAGRSSPDGAFCQCDEGLETAGVGRWGWPLDCRDTRWIHWKAVGLIALGAVTVEAIGFCIYTCAVHDHLRSSPLRAGFFMCDWFCTSGSPVAFATVGLGVTACMVGFVYMVYCGTVGCNLIPPIPLILIGGTFIALSIVHLFSVGERLLKVTCPAGIAGGEILRVDDDGQAVLNPYGDPITDGPALHRVLFSTHAVLVPEGILPGQQFNVWVGKEPSSGRCSCCCRRNGSIAAEYAV